MDRLILPLLLLALIITITFVVRRGITTVDSALTLEVKLDVLAQCGLTVADPFGPNDLVESMGRDTLEESGFDMVLLALAMTEEEEPWRNHCVNLWHFDTECIEDSGSYSQIAHRIVEMAKGSLPIDRIEDHVDTEAGTAWLSFRFQGQESRFDFEVDSDWVDSSVFGIFIERLRIAAPFKIFIYYDLGGQDCIIGCVTTSNLERLNHFDIGFIPLT